MKKITIATVLLASFAGLCCPALGQNNTAPAAKPAATGTVAEPTLDTSEGAVKLLIRHMKNAEFSKVPFERGAVGMARSQSPNSADSQFFIMFAAEPSLNGQYTIWGRVTGGMEHVDAIKKGANSRNGEVDNPDRIVKLQVAADVK